MESKSKNSPAKIKANRKYTKTHYKQLKVDIKPSDFDLIHDYCKSLGTSKAQFIVSSCKYCKDHKIFEKDLDHGEKSTHQDISSPVIYIFYNPDCQVSAGLGDELPDYTNWDQIAVLETPESRKANFILTVDGDSMEPRFSKGDLVLVKEQPYVDDGQIGIFAVDGKGYIKKKHGNHLISLNPKYDDIIVNSEYHKCFGLVLGKAEMVEEY